MGTNYYLIAESKEPCACCGRPYEREELHIGKSSGGWCFSLHVIPELGLNTLEDWINKWNEQGYYVEDEYEQEVTLVEMLDVITNRSWPEREFKPSKWYSTEREFLDKNQAIKGPNGLLRPRLEEGYCVGHGEGTWDYITGEFS